MLQRRSQVAWQKTSMTLPPTPLAGRLILLIDSDDFLSSYIEVGIRSSGATILGPARNLEEARHLTAHLRIPPDAAVVNLSLEGGSPISVVEALTARGVKLVLTGNHKLIVPAHLQALPFYRSPFASYQISQCIEGLLADVRAI
jgi:hypothetical protein